MNDDLLFVYGTLRRDMRSEMSQLLERHAGFVAEGRYQGRLYRIDYYPGVVPSDNPTETVKGEVYSLRDSQVVLQELDRYEECGPGFAEPTEYVRRFETVTLLDGAVCRAWIYIYNHPIDRYTPIPSGDFVASEADQNKSKVYDKPNR